MDDKLNEVTESVKALKGKFAGLESKFQIFKAEMIAEIEKRMGSLETKFERSQVKMQQTIITTMKWYIGGTGNAIK